jgi:3-phytase
MIHRRTTFAAASVLALLIAARPWPRRRPSVAPVGATVPTAQGGANASALLYNAADPAKSVIAATGELGGLEFYGLDGQRRSALPGGETYGVDARGDLIAVLDRKDGRLRLSRYDFASGDGHRLDARPLTLGYAGEGLCLHRSARDGALYAFTLGGEGVGPVAAVPGRRRQAGRPHRAPPAPVVRGQVLRRRRRQRHALCRPAGGRDLALRRRSGGRGRGDRGRHQPPGPHQGRGRRPGRVLNGGAQGADYLVAANADAGDYNVYDRNADDRFLGAFRIQANGADVLQGPSGLFGLRAPVGAGLPAGALLVTDDRKAGANTQVLSWKDVAAA